MRNMLGIVATLSLAALCLADPPQRPRDVSPLIAGVVQEYKVPGMVGAIVHGRDLVALGSAGVRKIGDPAPFTSDDLVHLGSDTKAMTAILIGQLIDQKQLAFDTPMKAIFPALAPTMDPQKANVTIKQLLNHNAGFEHDLPWGKYRGTLQIQRKHAVEDALTEAPATPIGQFAYSNVSYVMLGAIVEAKTGKAWEEVMRDNLFGPLKMTTAGFGVPGTIGKVDQPWGHILYGTLEAVQLDNRPVMAPAGEVHCSIRDWATFVAEILQSARGTPTLVSAGTFKELTTPFDGQHYAGGWIVAQRPWAKGRVLTHAGSNTTWFCVTWIAPNINAAYLDAINDGSAPAPTAADQGIARMIRLDHSP